MATFFLQAGTGELVLGPAVFNTFNSAPGTGVKAHAWPRLSFPLPQSVTASLLS